MPHSWARARRLLLCRLLPALAVLTTLSTIVVPPAAGHQDLVLAVHPFLPYAELQERFAPLAAMLAEGLDLPVSVRVGADYQEVLVAEEGRQAVALYREARAKGQRPDAVVLDLTVPNGLGGLAALAQLAELDPEVRAIVASGYSGDPVMAHYREHGFRAALVKPFSLEKVGQVLETVLIAD